jgi:hypothetical protein
MLEKALDLFDRHKYGVIGTLMLHTMLLFVLTMARVYRQPETATANELQVMLDLPPLEEQDPMTDEQPPSPASAADVTNRTSNATAEPDRSPPMSSAARARMGQRVEEDLRNLEQAEFDKLADAAQGSRAGPAQSRGAPRPPVTRRADGPLRWTAWAAAHALPRPCAAGSAARVRAGCALRALPSGCVSCV